MLPPVTVGAPGAVRSMRTVLVGPGLAGAQDEPLPRESTARNCTSVWPSEETVSDPPDVAADHVAPPSADVRYSYPANPAMASVDPEAETVADAMFCHASDPPVTVGAAGPLRSIRTVLVASGAAGAQAETLPAPSMLRSCTRVSPSAVTTADAPAVGASHVTPPLVDVRYW